jgi:hypothetical protein
MQVILDGLVVFRDDIGAIALFFASILGAVVWLTRGLPEVREK